jgi:DNA invertase Pin-like site-specific DNA recombinase
MKKAVAYFRVSTDRQGVSGLGLDAQADAVERFAHREEYTIIDRFTETESGKKDHRPQLAEAIARCKKDRATLIIAKLDRLSRRVSFISSLMDSKVEFRAVDNPHANRLMVHMLAAFAEHEREQISTRTKDALAAAKRRGQLLGQHGREVLSQQNAAAAVQFASDMRPIIQDIRSTGINTIRAITDELNRRGIAPYRKGKAWCKHSVHNLLKRVDCTDGCTFSCTT